MPVPGHQNDGSPRLVPLKISQAEFLRSNIFVSWSTKASREIRLVGPSLYDAWLLLEFDPDVAEFCERPPLALRLSSSDDQYKGLDFWVRCRTGKQYGLILYDATLPRDASTPIELLQRAVARAQFACEIWLTQDVKRRRIYLRNLKQLVHYIAKQSSRDLELEESLLKCVERMGRASWMDLAEFAKGRPPEAVSATIVMLIHSGALTAELSDQPLANSTILGLR